MRTVLGTTALLTAAMLTAAAAAVARPLTKIQSQAAFAVAGNYLVYETYPEDGVGTARILSRPITGGKPRTLLRFRVDDGSSGRQLYASAQRVAVLVRNSDVSRIAAGSPGKALRQLGPTLTGGADGASSYLDMDVDGPRVFAASFDDDHLKTTVFDRDGSSSPVRLPPDLDQAARYAGPFGAISVYDPGRTTVFEWQTGRVVRVLEGTSDAFPARVSIRPDGALAYPRDGGTWVAAPGQAPRPVAAHSAPAQWVGRQLVIVDRRNRIRAGRPGGKFRLTATVRPQSYGISSDDKHLAYRDGNHLNVVPFNRRP